MEHIMNKSSRLRNEHYVTLKSRYRRRPGFGSQGGSDGRPQ